MKLSYILQLKDLCIMLFFGFIIGIIYGIINIPNNIKKMIVVQIISDILFTILFFGIFIILTNIINQGEVRLFLCLGYGLGFILERISLGKIFAKSYKSVYTLIIKGIKSLYKSKIARIIFK